MTEELSLSLKGSNLTIKQLTYVLLQHIVKNMRENGMFVV